MHFQGLFGVAAILVTAVLLSAHRRHIRPRIVLTGLVLQVVLAFLCIADTPLVRVFDGLATVVTRVISFADAGTEFLFGKTADPSGPWGFVFAIRVLPVIIFFAALMSVLYHLRIMQVAVAGVAWVLRRVLGITGTEALSAAANIFVGQTEAPLTVRPYIAGMTRSQIMSIMTGGFASIAGSVLVAYVALLGGETDESRILFAKHLITASVMSAPGTFVIAKIMLPETEAPRDESLRSLITEPLETRNVVDAAAVGATDGLRLALNVAAMLVAFVALIALLNWPLAAFSRIDAVAAWRAANGLPEFTFQNLLGYALRPLAWCMGAQWSESVAFGSLLGQQVIATEFVAYLDLAKKSASGELSPRSVQIATYALCGFANLPSIAIQIGGLSALSPTRRADFASIAPRAMVAGALACWLSASIAGIFIG